MIVADTQEKNETIRNGCDKLQALSYEGPNGEHFSYDLHVITITEEHARFERKSMEDCIGSFKEGKLDRQVSATDGLIVEWVPSAWMLSNGMSPEATRLMQNCYRHLQRMAMFAPVIITDGAQDTLDFLRHLENRPKLGKFRDNTINAGRESTLSGILRALPGVNPDRDVGGQPLSEALRTRFSAELFFDAIGLEGWVDIPGVGPGTVKNVKEAVLNACAGV